MVGLAQLGAFPAGLPWAPSWVCSQLQVKELGDLGGATAGMHGAKPQSSPLSKDANRFSELEIRKKLEQNIPNNRNSEQL